MSEERRVPDIIEIATEADLDKLITKDSKVVVDFWVEWCVPCRRLKTILPGIAHEYAPRGVTFASANADLPNIAILCDDYGVMGFPTLLAFDGDLSQPIDELVGVIRPGFIRSFINLAFGL